MAFAMFFFCLATLFSSIYRSSCVKRDKVQSIYCTEDAQLNFTQLATKYGNSVEEHDVITEDGYILTIFHVIPEEKLQHTPILLQHGILDSADTFVIRGNKSLVRALASAGHDVWVGNFRGNRYGRRHLRLNPEEGGAFWNYTFHEIGVYDAAAVVTFVLSKSRTEKLNVIGHSLGNTIFYVLGSMRPEFNHKINMLIALSPIAFLNHMRPPLTYFVGSAQLLLNFFMALGLEEVPPADPALRTLQQIVCAEKTFGYNICARGFILALSGFDTEQLDRGFFPTLMGHYPQPHSRKGLMHLTQVARRKNFSQFDYGNVSNLLLYKSVNPADYDLNKVTMPVVLFVGKNDIVSTLEDAMLLKKKLPNVKELFIMKPETWNHIDWVWGTDSDKYFYPSLFKFLNQPDIL